MSDHQDAREKFLRVVGKRRPPEPGQPPPKASRNAMTAMARYRTRVPKGVFFYASHEEANRDWERWQIETMMANTKVRGG